MSVNVPSILIAQNCHLFHQESCHIKCEWFSVLNSIYIHNSSLVFVISFHWLLMVCELFWNPAWVDNKQIPIFLKNLVDVAHSLSTIVCVYACHA